MSTEHYLKIVDLGNTLSHGVVELRDRNHNSPPLAVFYQNASRPNSIITENQRYESLIYFLAGLQYLKTSDCGTITNAPCQEDIFKRLIQRLENGEKIMLPSEVGRSFLENQHTFLEIYLGHPIPRW